jgi:hypothetical protein
LIFDINCHRFASAAAAVSDSEPEDGELQESELAEKKRRKKRRRKSSDSSHDSEARERKRKISTTYDEERGRGRKKKHSESPHVSSDGDDSASSNSKSRQDRRSRNSKKKSRRSRSPSPYSIKKERDKDLDKSKKKTGMKKLSFEKIVKKMTPKELKSYLREFKKSQEEPETKQEEEEEEKQKELPDEDKDKYPSHIGDKKAYYYCLICTEHIGSVKKWARHRAQSLHRERLEETAAEARRKYNCQDIDLQDCVISDAEFAGNPCAQCRECLCIFYSGEELAAHMSRGMCSVKAAQAAGAAAYSGASSETIVQFGKRAASPPPPAAPAKEPPKDFPKYLLNGKLAYYFCIVCNTTVGTLIEWHRHYESEAHVGMRKHFSGGALQPEYQLLAHLRRGNPEHRCLICQVSVADMNYFYLFVSTVFFRTRYLD